MIRLSTKATSGWITKFDPNLYIVGTTNPASGTTTNIAGGLFTHYGAGTSLRNYAIDSTKITCVSGDSGRIILTYNDVITSDYIYRFYADSYVYGTSGTNGTTMAFRIKDNAGHSVNMVYGVTTGNSTQQWVYTYYIEKTSATTLILHRFTGAGVYDHVDVDVSSLTGGDWKIEFSLNEGKGWDCTIYFHLLDVLSKADWAIFKLGAARGGLTFAV